MKLTLNNLSLQDIIYFIIFLFI